MLRVLQSVGEFDCVTHPAILVDDRFDVDACFDAAKRPLPGRTRLDYHLVFVDPIDVLDWDRCKLEFGYLGAEIWDGTYFKVPQSGYPPFFRVTGADSRMYVSNAARRAIEEEDLWGVEFEDVVDQVLTCIPLEVIPSEKISASVDRRPINEIHPPREGEDSPIAGSPTPRPLTAAEEHELVQWSSVGAHMDEFYEFDIDTADGAIQAVNAAVENYRRTGDLAHYRLPELRTVHDLAMALGTWWAETLQGETTHKQVMLCWEDEGREEIAVVPEDGSWAVLPMRFLQRLLTDTSAENTTILTYNMCKAGRAGGAPGSYMTIG